MRNDQLSNKEEIVYRTVAKMKLKPGSLQAIKEFAEEESGVGMDGFVGQYVYQMDRDPDEIFVVVLFKDKTSYFANAESPEQNARFQQMMTYLAAEPEWNDGEVIYSEPGSGG